mmetsp:Transcript_106549/g.211692  ORF Transcript_106549/g.211692 Transcript_106549/m.211692 type:complete len:211 (-) Transcript_106549:254-886(-)
MLTSAAYCCLCCSSMLSCNMRRAVSQPLVSGSSQERAPSFCTSPCNACAADSNAAAKSRPSLRLFATSEISKLFGKEPDWDASPATADELTIALAAFWASTSGPGRARCMLPLCVCLGDMSKTRSAERCRARAAGPSAGELHTTDWQIAAAGIGTGGDACGVTGPALHIFPVGRGDRGDAVEVTRQACSRDMGSPLLVHQARAGSGDAPG